MATQPIHQFYSELKGYTPSLWRRFQVVGNITLAKLGYIVMTLYEMKACHLFCIEYSVSANLPEVPNDRVLRYEVPTGDSLPGFMDEQSHDATQMTLRRFTSSPGTILSVQHDYGDGWEITLTLEAVLWDEALQGRLLPRVQEGEGYGIVEDCGGPDGLASLLNGASAKQSPHLSHSQKRRYVRVWI